MPDPLVDLYYWPMLQGRGEFIRLILEEAAVPYRDVARLAGDTRAGVDVILSLRAGQIAPSPIFAPPVVRVGEIWMSQTAVICQTLGERHGLAPTGDAARATVAQLQHTILDVVSEAHDTHHPLGTSLYYEDQRDAASARAALFIHKRMPAFLAHFHRIQRHHGGDFLTGPQMTYADLSLFQVLEGLSYAFPKGFAAAIDATPELLALRDRVAHRPRIAAYLASERRLPFNTEGIFRHYPELDMALEQR